MFNPIDRFIQIEKRRNSPRRWQTTHWRWHAYTIGTPWFIVFLGRDLNLDSKWWRTYQRK